MTVCKLKLLTLKIYISLDPVISNSSFYFLEYTNVKSYYFLCTNLNIDEEGMDLELTTQF